MNIRVAKVIDSYKLIINKGVSDGIQLGQRLLVYSMGEEINDPETGISLGKLEIVKGTGIVTHVQEKISTVESDRKSKSFKKIIRKPILLYQQFGGEEEIINPSETIPFDDPKEGDLVKGI